MTRVKICGITTPDDAKFTAAAGADAIGLVFYKKSPRAVTIAQAQAICAVLPPFVATVGLFVNADADAVKHILAQVPLTNLQFHGAESPDYCSQFMRPYLKAVPMQGLADFAAYADQYQDAQGFLVDSHAPDTVGGSGKTFDWITVPQDYQKPLILAGGLTPHNVARAIQITNVYAVDVSSGVEEFAGKKSAAKVRAFMDEVKQVSE
ncbi:MAG TPA: phosphoribosylanthranilate isomerase [Thiothrix sp.]|nr:phosphoribosylanthranilate isomerase [Thiothrix sp.]